jgi:hypothetical protein
MRRWAVVLSALSVSLGAATAVAGTASADNDNDPYTLSGGHAQAGPMGGVVHAKDAKPGSGPKQSPNLTYHGGRVQTSPTEVHAIFWGSSWSNSTFVGDKVTGLATLYGGLTTSTAYAGTNTEYTNGSNAHVNSNVASYDAVTDTSAAPTRAPQTSAVLAEVARQYPHPTPNAYYPVYIDGKRGNAGYCAWHSSGTINGTQVQFGFFFNLDGDAGCDPKAPTSLHSQGLSALANVTGHEFSEMVTDPQLNAWYDSQGSENSDKCAWTFNGVETLGNGSQWLIQGNWSNAAYTGNHGYISGTTKYRGCINGNPLQF